MRRGRRSNSILTVHFKRQSSSSPSPIAKALTSSPIDSKITCPTLSFCFSLLKRSAKVGHVCAAEQAHVYTIKLGFCSSLSLQNQVLNAYVKCKDFDGANKVFDEMPERNTVTWNIMIHGVINCGDDTKQIMDLGFWYLREMLLSKVGLDYVSFIQLTRLCTDVNDVKAGSQLHCLIVKLGFTSSCFLSTSLVDFYGKCGFVTEARRVFDQVLNRDLVLWNTLIFSYVLSGMMEEAFGILKLMGSKVGLKGDGFTLSSLLSGCRSLEGRQLHGYAFKLSFESDITVATSLVNMYAKSFNMRDARNCFESMVDRSVVLWNSMIVGYGQLGDAKEAMRLFVQMLNAKFHPDEFTFGSILSSCTKIAAVREITQVQCYITRKGFGAFSSVANALINAYSKTGSISEALICFHSIQMPDLVSWTSVIGALGFHGFLEVLSACSHGGLVQEGLRYFEQMTDVYKIEPDSEHYTCLIDLLSRAGFIHEAFQVLTSMPMEPSSHALAAFMGACNVHGNRESMKWAAKKLVELEPSNPANYSILSSVYVSEGHWKKAALIRKTVNKSCNAKIPGCSWVRE